MIQKEKIIDSWLVIQTRNGNAKALGTLVKRWNKKLIRQAFWYTKDLDSAKDVAQECWPSIIKNFNSLKDPYNFGSWALSIATRKSIDFLRKRKREMQQLEVYYDNDTSSTTQVDETNTGDQILLLKSSIKELPTQQQLILNLFYLEELTTRQISEVLVIPQGTVKSRLFNARALLKSIIKNKNHEK